MLPPILDLPVAVGVALSTFVGAWAPFLAINSIFGRAMDRVTDPQQRSKFVRRLSQAEQTLVARSAAEWRIRIAEHICRFWLHTPSWIEATFGRVNQSPHRKLILRGISVLALVVLAVPLLELRAAWSVGVAAFAGLLTSAAIILGPQIETDGLNRKAVVVSLLVAVGLLLGFRLWRGFLSPELILAGLAGIAAATWLQWVSRTEVGRHLAACGLASAALSIVAIFIGFGWDGPSTTRAAGSISGQLGLGHQPTAFAVATTLTLINFPFDALAIWVSIRLLSWAVRLRSYTAVASLVDVAASGIIALGLRVLLEIIETPSALSLRSVQQLVSGSLFWAESTFCYLTSQPCGDYLTAVRDLRLAPLVLTTLVPVFLYGVLFILVGMTSTAMRFVAFVFKRPNAFDPDDSSATPFQVLADTISILLLVLVLPAYWVIANCGE